MGHKRGERGARKHRAREQGKCNRAQSLHRQAPVRAGDHHHATVCMLRDAPSRLQPGKFLGPKYDNVFRDHDIGRTQIHAEA